MTYVYFAKHAQTSLIKIGMSINPIARTKALRTELIGVIAGDQKREREIHKQFHRLRVMDGAGLPGTEWFKDDPEISDFIKRKSLALDAIVTPKHIQLEPPPMDEHPIFYTAKDVGELMQVKEATVRLWLRRGLLCGIQVGRTWRISQKHLDAIQNPILD